MTKELRALLNQLDTMKQDVRSLLGDNKVEEAETRMNDVRTLQKKIEVQRALEEGERGEHRGGIPAGGEPRGPETREDAELEKEYRSIFMNALRRRPVSEEQRSIIREYEQRAVMNEGGTNPAIPDGNSALIVPQDIQTRINTIMRTLNDLSQYVQVEPVSTLSGSRVLEKDETMTPFAIVDEYGLIPETDNPKFVNVPYSVKKRSGILPLTNELLADSDQNVIDYVTKWIARKAVVTKNSQITTLLRTMTPTVLADLTAIKKVINVTLDPAISATAVILTNQDGYHWLDSQKDSDGRFLLQDDITQPGRKLLFGKPLAVASNRYVANITGTPNKAPIWIGNLAQLIVLFERRFYELASTKEGGDAFKRDTTDLRTIMRNDIKFWDSGAAVYGQINLS
ncbi:phage major capsid protein [Ammoniphilus sp. YIM 78166]|uniref:phage major capsid protein n=1 Tax=Ammoniphilus sp. YIM 78166 TaxID=1644106 RepID=UPI00106F27CF|nr:phage major capsid protein [Ammoniphilus sp. YIM 78166]